MKRLSVRIASLFLCLQLLVPTLALAQVADNEIRVLAVSTNGVSTADVIAQMNFLESFWPGSNGVVVDLANGGVPVPLPVTLTGSDTDQLSQAIANPLWSAYRSTWGADLMIVFTANLTGTSCGRAVQYNWTSVDDPIPGLYVGDPLNFNLDLRGSSNGYSAIVETGGGCPTLTAAHEMAHLLGSGHTKSVAEGKYLTSTSHASALAINLGPWGGIIALKTIAAQGENPPECQNSPYGALQCQYFTVYSDGQLFNSDADTLGTFAITALSVANYFAGSGEGGGGGGGGGGGQFPECNDGIDNDDDGFTDYPNDPDCASLGDDDESDTGGGGGGGGGGCGLQAPANLIATVVGVCLPPPYTQYTLTWTDACPSATFNYEIHKAQPVTSGFVFGWNAFVPSTPAFINGASARAKVRACGLSSCSGFSDTVLVVDGC